MTIPIEKFSEIERRVALVEHKVSTIEKLSDKTDHQYAKIIERLEKMQIVEERLVAQGEEVKRAFSDIAKAREIAEKTAQDFRDYVNRIEGMKKIAWAAWSVMGGIIGWMIYYIEVSSK